MAVTQAGPIPVPNASFESPAAIFGLSINVDSWQKMPKPDWYEEDPMDPVTLWGNRVGIFKNLQDSTFIDNCDGAQALWLFAVPDVGVFQDYDSLDWNDSAPTHEFDATFQVGKAYRMTVGILVGRNAGPPMQEGVTLDMTLYYRNASSSREAVATTVVSNSYSVFTSGTHLLDCEVNVPVVKPDDPWAGKHIGIQFLSTVSTNMQGGYWDLDNVRLTEITPPMLSSCAWSNDQFQFTVQGETGAVIEILASTNAALPLSEWVVAGVLTNETGEVPFIDTSGMFEQRYYRARQLP